jgi:hypothetical protein
MTEESGDRKGKAMWAHEAIIETSAGPTRVDRTEVTGPEAGELGPLVTADFPAVLAALKELAERP